VLKTAVEHLVTLIEAGGAFVIALGALLAFR
jgi:hypothetical protein